MQGLNPGSITHDAGYCRPFGTGFHARTVHIPALTVVSEIWSIDIERVQVSTQRFFAVIEGRRRVRVIDHLREAQVDQWSLAASAGTVYAGQVFAERFLENSGAAAQLRGFAHAIRAGVAPRSTLEDAIETHQLAAQIDKRSA